MFAKQKTKVNFAPTKVTTLTLGTFVVIALFLFLGIKDLLSFCCCCPFLFERTNETCETCCRSSSLNGQKIMGPPPKGTEASFFHTHVHTLTHLPGLLFGSNRINKNGDRCCYPSHLIGYFFNEDDEEAILEFV